MFIIYVHFYNSLSLNLFHFHKIASIRIIQHKNVKLYKKILLNYLKLDLWQMTNGDKCLILFFYLKKKSVKPDFICDTT